VYGLTLPWANSEDAMSVKSGNQEQHREKLNILVVEDNDLLREVYLLVLRAQHKVFGARGAKEGWRLYNEKKPDIVFMDIRLPDGSGHDLTRKIKEDDPLVYVIMATVNDIVEEKERAANNHADGFIAKPFNKDEINDCIERCLSLKQRDA
jgi:DNA-binding NtrC family response regulator